jgi:hypothetical protein
VLEYPRESILACTLLLTVLALALFYVAFFTRRRPRTACRGCNYDLSSHAPALCPECGRDPRLASPPRRVIRRLPLAFAVLFTLLAGGLFLARTPLQNWWWNQLPAWIPASTLMHQGIEYRILTPRGPIDMPRTEWPTLERRLECRVGNGEWFTIVPSDFVIELDQLKTVDVTGDGVPEHLIETYSGGAHCCHTLYVLDTTRDGLLLAVIDGTHSGFRIADLDRDGVAEVTLADWTFGYWHTTYVASPRPEVVLSFDGNRFSPAVHLMRKAPPAEAELEAQAAEARAAALPISDDPHPLLHPFWGPALDLLYSGNADHARRFLDLAWPGNGLWKEYPTKDAFLAALEAELNRSPWWPQIVSGYAALRDSPAASGE